MSSLPRKAPEDMDGTVSGAGVQNLGLHWGSFNPHPMQHNLGKGGAEGHQNLRYDRISSYIQEKQINVLPGAFIVAFHHIWLCNPNDSVQFFVSDFLYLRKNNVNHVPSDWHGDNFSVLAVLVITHRNLHFPDKDSWNYEPLDFLI